MAGPVTFRRGELAGLHFQSRRAAETHRARLHGFRSHEERIYTARPITSRNLGELSRLSGRESEKRSQAIAALARARHEDMSLARAAKLEGTTVANVKKWAPAAVKLEHGRYTATPSDRYSRAMLIPTAHGPATGYPASSRQASLLGSYWMAVKRYVESGNDIDLRRFDGRYLRLANKTRVPFITDRALLRQLANAGLLTFDAIYVEAPRVG